MGRISLAPLALLALSLAAMTGCSSPRALEGPTVVSVVEGSNLPPPTRPDLTVTGRPYVIGPYDRLKMGVFGIEDLQDIEAQVDGAGRVSFPLAGDLVAAGKTPGELADVIENRLRESHIRNPQVSVNLDETVSQVVAVSGQVTEPGLYPVLGRLTLLGALAQAKGTTELARQDDVVVFRTVGGTQMAALYNIDAIRRGLYEDPQIYANDRIMVGTSRARRLFRDILSGAPLLTTPIIAVLTSNNNN